MAATAKMSRVSMSTGPRPSDATTVQHDISVQLQHDIALPPPELVEIDEKTDKEKEAKKGSQPAEVNHSLEAIEEKNEEIINDIRMQEELMLAMQDEEEDEPPPQPTNHLKVC